MFDEMLPGLIFFAFVFYLIAVLATAIFLAHLVIIPVTLGSVSLAILTFIGVILVGGIGYFLMLRQLYKFIGF